MNFIGVDIGGMSIKVGLVDADGALHHVIKEETGNQRTQTELTETLLAMCTRVRKAAEADGFEIGGVGFGFPGTVNNETEVVHYTANIPGFNHCELGKIFRERFDSSLVYALGNDADAAALAEVYYGSGRGRRYFVLITLGTGVGGGIVLNKKLYTGCNAVATEIGHMCLVFEGEPCGCGGHGCFEAYSSATALMRQTRDMIKACPESMLGQVPLASVDGRTAFEFKRKGCAKAAEVIDRYIAYLAAGIRNLIVLLQPDCIAIGGGISHAGDELLIPLQQEVKRELFAAELQRTDLVLAELGNDAGIIGAGCLARSKWEELA